MNVASQCDLWFEGVSRRALWGFKGHLVLVGRVKLVPRLRVVLLVPQAANGDKTRGTRKDRRHE